MILLARIIEVVSKQEFKEWMQANIFQALGMNDSFIEEDFAVITKNTATSYASISPGKFKTCENYDLTYGASNLYTTASDLNKWTSNFFSGNGKWKNAFTTLQTLDSLESNEASNYAFGVFVDSFKGNRRVYHTGGVAGFQAIYYTYPDDELTIIILSNFTSFQLSQMANHISSLFLKDNSKTEANTPEIKPINLKNNELSMYEGSYWNDKRNYARKIQLLKDTLWYIRENGAKSPLIPIGKTDFLIGGINEKIIIQFDAIKQQMTLNFSNNTIENLVKFNSEAPSPKTLEKYVGTYYNSELDISYSIRVSEHQIFVHNSRFGEFEIQYAKPEVLNWGDSCFSKFIRNENQEITGFYIDMYGVKNLIFKKLN